MKSVTVGNSCKRKDSVTSHCQISLNAVVSSLTWLRSRELLSHVFICPFLCAELLLLPFTNCLNTHSTLICERFRSVSGLLQSLLPCLPARLYLNLTLGIMGAQRSLQSISLFSQGRISIKTFNGSPFIFVFSAKKKCN